MNYKDFKIYSVKRKDVDELYVVTPCGSSYYLFSSRHSGSAHRYYEKGVRYDRAVDFTAAKRNHKICSIMERIPAAVRYVSKEYVCV